MSFKDCEKQNTELAPIEKNVFKAWGQATVAEYKYKKMYNTVSSRMQAVNILSYSFPILMTVLLFLSSQQKYKHFNALNLTFEIIGSIGSVVVLLIALTFIYFCGYEEKKEKYRKGMDSNLRIADEAKNLFQLKKFDNLDWFFRFIQEQDKDDNIYLSDENTKLQKAAYTHWLEVSGQECISCYKNAFDKRANIFYKCFKWNRVCDKCGALKE
jgi:mobilome CxxCx(11)CxxC protein